MSSTEIQSAQASSPKVYSEYQLLNVGEVAELLGVEAIAAKDVIGHTAWFYSAHSDKRPDYISAIAAECRKTKTTKKTHDVCYTSRRFDLLPTGRWKEWKSGPRKVPRRR